MSLACFTADHHIKLGQKNVPIGWQKNRFMALADILNKVECDYHIFGGDLFDVAKPSIQEVGLCYDFLKRIDKPIKMIPGNHEMENKKSDCYIHIAQMLEDLGVTTYREFTHNDGIDYIPYNILKRDFPGSIARLAVTHVRGSIPPHVEPEVPLSKFSTYEKVFAGDLHSYTNSQENIWYPGSPISTSFHRRVPSGSNGYFLIDTVSGEHTWTEIILPHLIRETVASEKDIIATEFHHTIYELEGTVDELGKVNSSIELLDKKVNTHISTESTLDFNNEIDISEELSIYLEKIKGIMGVPKKRLMGRFHEHTSN